ncbi:hypothetical protein Kpol_1002p2 [Vanderwaltozyma polyspora DSM 70294]|uniref:Uncharacterized protein n=1 Tax=Vanderwaltozyma polyspora (strain ATCC 22028 / DSM 70294 / BCRC 21397 / CBS 2163 / NBRC 10782 / NRRL Y-8283 / UCD 57-17) TaxID=436907 RepID=A7TE35_VANPO|nr:uncharacterized protein Kpol_1002p2 [Vanderwaltozyma polyspora DSM 70294]EDO19357.1 hypothetical protein Kpol_1002p2 [Vanderwaltozyma polyspora DSM 70294]
MVNINEKPFPNSKVADSNGSELYNNVENSESLFHWLNKFIYVVDAGQDQSDLISPKNVALFIRSTILSYLRNQVSQLESACDQGERDALIQWWVTLLNFLNSDTSTSAFQTDTYLTDTDIISVSLECISKIITVLMILPEHSFVDLEIYSHHLLITTHYVTNRLIINSKLSKQIQKNAALPEDDAASNLRFFHKYNSLLRSFVGKLTAYAFIYLPDSFNFDTLVLYQLNPNLNHVDNNTIFSWKQRKFFQTSSTDQNIKLEDIETKDTHFFKIIISHLKHEFTFLAFYWHYWYIITRYSSFSKNKSEFCSNLDLIPGSHILLNYTIYDSLDQDLQNLRLFLTSKQSSQKQSDLRRADLLDATEVMPDTDQLVPKYLSNSNRGSKPAMISNEELNNYIFTRFKSTKLWESLRSLTGCLGIQIIPVLKLHDEYQLKYISKISAYDSHSGNIFYNKILQFLLFQFRSLNSIDFLNWDIWLKGIYMMLNTLHVNCQASSLLSLFNIWNYLPDKNQKELAKLLLTKYFTVFIIENDFHITKLLFTRLLIFKVLQLRDTYIRSQCQKLLQDINEEVKLLHHKNLDLKWNKDTKIMYFQGNKRFVLTPYREVLENNLIFKHQTELRSRAKSNDMLFPSVLSTSNIRPTVILRGGRYPFDILDDLATRGEIIFPGQGNRSRVNSRDRYSDDRSDDYYDKYANSFANSISTTINSWISRISTSVESSMSSADSSIKRSDGYEQNSIEIAPELMYSKPILTSDTTSLLLKPIIMNNDDYLRSVDKANRKWGIVTARTYDKPLPIPDRSQVNGLANELKLMSIASFSSIDYSFDVVDENISKKDSNLLKKNESAQETIPVIKLHGIFGNKSINDNDNSSILLSNANILSMSVQDLNLLKTNNEEEDGTIIVENYYKNKEMYLKTRFEKLTKFIEIFNETLIQYTETLNIINHESLFMEYEVRDENNRNTNYTNARESNQ